MSRTLWPLAALATVALIGAGCSNDSAENGSTGANKKLTARDMSVKWSGTKRPANAHRPAGRTSARGRAPRVSATPSAHPVRTVRSPTSRTRGKLGPAGADGDLEPASEARIW